MEINYREGDLYRRLERVCQSVVIYIRRKGAIWFAGAGARAVDGGQACFK